MQTNHLEQSDISLCLISLNEVEGLKYFLPQLMSLNKNNIYEIFAIDGGSTDGSMTEYQKFGIQCYQQEKMGRGQAIQQAVRLAKTKFVILFSPDGNEDLSDLKHFNFYFKQDYDLVIASRMMNGARNEEDSQFFKWRKWANLFFNFSANLFFNKSPNYITDSINGFRGFKKSLFHELNIDTNLYDIEYQMTIRSLKQRKKIIEFPTQENQRLGGVTKVKSFQAGFIFLRRLALELIE